MNAAFFPPMPDELAEAHAGRIGAFLAGTISKVQRHSLIRKLAEAVVPSAGALPSSWQLAALSGMPRTDYVRHHTMLPVIAVVEGQGPTSPFGAEKPSRVIRSGATLHARRVHLCRKCVQEDLSSRPYSWFRRNHNLPGIEMCPRHACPLESVHAPDPWCRLPHHWWARGDTEPSEINPQSKSECQFQVRLQETYQHFLDRDRPYHLAHLHAFLRKRARELEPKKSPYDMYSAVVFKAAPKEWVRRNCPEIGSGHVLDAIGSSIALPSHGFLYAVLLGAMFSNAEEFERSMALSDRTSSNDVELSRLAA
jgi:hypothetical protein